MSSWSINIGRRRARAVLCIELSMITENVIKGEPIHLFCHIPNFTNIASFDMPKGLPFRNVVCNNRDGCSINEHKIFNVNSNSSGLILTLKVLNETVEGEYACTYKGQIQSYSLKISTLNIIDPNNGCNITKTDVKYECQTKCVMLKNNQMIQWEFKTDRNETISWNTSASHGDCNCCKDNKQQFVSHRTISDQDGMLKCFITVSRDVTIWSPLIRVKSVADDKTVIIISIITLLAVVVVSVILILYKRHRKHITKSNIKQMDKSNSSEGEVSACLK